MPITDHGSYRADLRAFLDASYQIANHPEFAGVLRAQEGIRAVHYGTVQH